MDTTAQLAVLRWRREDAPFLHAVDDDNGAIRVSDRWGPDFVLRGFWTCGTTGPRGRWATFEEAVDAAYRHLVLREPEPDPSWDHEQAVADACERMARYLRKPHHMRTVEEARRVGVTTILREIVNGWSLG